MIAQRREKVTHLHCADVLFEAIPSETLNVEIHNWDTLIDPKKIEIIGCEIYLIGDMGCN